MKKIAVTGAFSYTGRYITQRLLAQGNEVLTLTNHPNRPNPFNGQVQAHPLDFDLTNMTKALMGVDTLYNTYWVRFDKASNTQPQAVENTRLLVKAAQLAGVRRMVHISITNPSPDSPLPYFWGKAANEKAVIDSGMQYAILRPTVLFGKEDVLINNIAWLLRRFPFFAQIGDGQYKIQPVHVDDVAALAVEAGNSSENLVWDAVGPEIYTFDGLVKEIGEAIGYAKPILHTHPQLALRASQLIGLFLGDVVLTPEEVDGLMANLLVSPEPARCPTKISTWLRENQDVVGVHYANEIKRHYQ